MSITYLTEEQADRAGEFRSFTDRYLGPRSDAFDAEQELPSDVIKRIADQGYIGATVPKESGGLGMTMVEYGLLTEELGRGCQSVRNFVAVEDMVARSVHKWGTSQQRERWLPRILSGEAVAAFALTEPGVGSDAKSIETTAVREGEEFVLRGTKKWISFAQIADVFLLFAMLDGRHTAFLVERDTPGLAVEPLEDLMGLRASHLGEVTLDDCRIPVDGIVGRPGLGLTFVASNALDLGRYSTAWGSVGLAQACLEASRSYAAERVQFGSLLKDHQLVQRMLTDMATDTMAARLLCHHAGASADHGDPDAVHNTLMAKYRASTVAVGAADHAVQIHGARGVGGGSAVQRHYRDAKIMEIIEGASQIQQVLLGDFVAGKAR